MKKILLILFLLACPVLASAQVVPYSDIVLTSRGTPAGGALVAVCGNPGLGTTGAQVTSNIAILTMASNPVTAGFFANMTLTVSGFTGADTYFNGTFTTLTVTSTTITYALTHANASATSNGSAFQTGTAAIACAPLSSIFSDQAGLVPITQPGFLADGLGNYQFYAAANSYNVQFYGPVLTVRVKPIVLPVSTVNGTTTLTNLTVSGTGTTANLNGCQHVNAIQSFATALAAASTPGCIQVDPGTYTVSVNAAIPATVSLVSQSGGLLSIANTVTLTINGPIVAPPAQIFAYVGTGTVSLGVNAAVGVRAVWFPGADILAQIKNAYNALPSPGGSTLIVDPNPAGAGACWIATTTASLNTTDKYVLLQGTPSAGNNNNTLQGGTCINYTPTIIGSAGTISAISWAGNLVSVTCAATCTTGWTGGGGASATVITIRGVTEPSYNGVYLVQTVTDGTHFTYTVNLGSPNASSGGTVAQSPFALEFDWTNSIGGSFTSGSGMDRIVLQNNACFTIGGCGSYAVGILAGRTNGGMHAAILSNNKITGFGTAVSKINNPVGANANWGTAYWNTSIAYNNVGITYGFANENDTSHNGRIVQNGTNLQLNAFGAEFTKIGGSLESATICGVQMAAGSLFHAIDVHWENNTTWNTSYICGGGTLNSMADVVGGTAYDDCISSGVPVGCAATSTPWFTSGLLAVKGLQLLSNGRSPASAIFVANKAGNIDILNVSPGALPFSSLASRPTVNLNQSSFSGVTNSISSPLFTFPEVTAPSGQAGDEVCYGDSTAHAVECNYNNTGFGLVPLTTTINSFTGNTVALTADWTCGTGGTVASCTSATIIGSGGGVPLTFTLPLFARSYTLECDGVVGQATAATANQWNLLTATNGATNVTANYSMATAATASAFGAVTDQASTTTTFQIAPSWTLGGTATKMPFHIWAKVEGASASGTVVSLQLVAPTVGDLVTIYRGTACRLF